jgi:hypothetical protein
LSFDPTSELVFNEVCETTWVVCTPAGAIGAGGGVPTFTVTDVVAVSPSASWIVVSNEIVAF